MTRPLVFVVAWFLAGATAGHAQILTGNIIGTVKDESEAVLPGVTVTLTSKAQAAGPVTVVTNEKGEYRFTQLSPGSYALTVVLAGFSTYQESGLVVLVSGTTERTVTLKLASVAETITVSGESPMVDTRKVALTANVTQEVIEKLPARRNVTSAYLKWSGPGVAPTDPSGYDASVSVLGSGVGENSILFDGMMSTNPSGGTYKTQGDLDAAEEIQVVALGASAEYQVAQGAVFNVVYKSGTNVLKGDARSQWYPDSLESKPIKLPCNCSLGQTGYTKVKSRRTGNLGGPVIKDRVWFFGAGIWSDRAEANPGVDSRLQRTQYNNTLIGKGTWQINDQLKFRQTVGAEWFRNPDLPTPSRPYATVGGNGGDHQPNYVSELTTTISNVTLLTVRATGYSTPKHFNLPASGDIITPFHLDQLTGVACCGVQSFLHDNIARHGQAAKLNRFIQGARIEHDLRVGVQFEEARNYTFTALPSGVNYSDLGGKPDQATFRNAFVQGAEYKSQGVWAEDQMVLGGRLTVSLGTRFDRMHAVSPDLPAVDNQLNPTGATIKGLGDMFTWNVWAPRLGFNLKLTADSKTILRGNYGRAYRTIFLNDFLIVYPGLSPTTLARWNPATNSYSTIISVTDPLANIRVDPNIKAPFTDQYSVGVDRELAKNVGVGATYVHKYGEQLIGWKDIGGVYGTQAVVLPDGRTVTVDPLLSGASQRLFLRTNGPGTFTRYDGLVLTMEKRMSQRWQATLSYTDSKATGLTTTAQDPNSDINASALLSTDRPHMLVGGGTYEIPSIDVHVSAHLMVVSGTPFAPQALVSLPQGRLAINIAPADGTYRYSAQKLLYFRFSKILLRHGDRRLELGADIANALQNEAANAIVSQNFYGSTFAQPASWIEPRRMTLLAKVWF